MFSKILRGAVIAAIGVGVAQADPFTGLTPGSLDFEGHSDGWKAVNGWAAGQFDGYFPNGASHLNEDFFRFFCIDTSHIANWNPLSYARSEIVDSTKIGLLAELFDRHYPLGTLGTSYFGTGLGDFTTQTLDSKSYTQEHQSAAMQLAIWEIWYDSTSLNYETGTFKWTSGDGHAKTLADYYLSELNSSDPYTPAHAWTFYEFSNTLQSQNYLSAIYKPGTSFQNNVPLPGTLALLGISLAGLGLARRKTAA